MAITITHCGASYECAVAVKCENDKYIKLYDESGAEIASFNGISDFADFSISGGSFVAPCDCAMPIALTTYVIGGRTIAPGDWLLSDDGYYYEIACNLISGNATTCDILLIFEPGTEFEYSATQAEGKIILSTEAAPLYDIVIDSIQITRV